MSTKPQFFLRVVNSSSQVTQEAQPTQPIHNDMTKPVPSQADLGTVLRTYTNLSVVNTDYITDVLDKCLRICKYFPPTLIKIFLCILVLLVYLGVIIVI